MVFEVLLHLTAHHLIHLCSMFGLYEEFGELMNLKQSVGESAILAPQSVFPKNLAIILGPSLNHFMVLMRCLTKVMIRISHPRFMKLFTQRHRFSSYEIWRITMECCLHRT